MVYVFLYVIVDALSITTMTTPQVKEMNHTIYCITTKSELHMVTKKTN